MTPLGLAAAIAVGAGVIVAMRRTPSNPGEAARTGDVVHVPVDHLPAGALPPGFPTTGAIAVQVQHTSLDALDGPVIGLVASEDPLVQSPIDPPVGPIRVDRTAVGAVYRGNKLLT